MPNRRRDPVGYRPFRAEPLLAEGLLAVARPGGEFMQRVSAGLFRLAGDIGEKADRQVVEARTAAGERSAVEGRPRASIAATVAGGDAIDMAKSLLRSEENFRSSPYWDVNALRTGYGSDTVTTADGKVVKVGKDTRVTRADAERDLDRRLTQEFIPRAIGQVGEPNWNRLPPAARAALASVGYNYGALPASVVKAVRGGSIGAVADAVERLKSNPDRRKREAALIRNGGASGDGGPAIELSGGTARPTGSDTLAGRAFDEAQARTYVQLLETEMRSVAGQLYDRHRDDPFALERSLAEARQAFLNEHVFDEIAADFEVGFGRLAESYLGQARDNQAREIEKADRADFIGRTAALETDLAKRLADFDPANDAAADTIASTQAAIDAHYDDAVDRGVLSPERAEQAKAASRRETALSFYGRQAEALDADGVATMREDLRKDFVAGKRPELDGDGWQVLDRNLDQLERTKRRAAATAARSLRKAGDQLAGRVAAGFGLDPDQWARFLLDAESAVDGDRIVAATNAKIAAARVINGRPLREARDLVADMRKSAGDTPDDDTIAALDFAETLLDRTETALRRDPVAHGERMRVIEPQTDFAEAETPADLAELVTARIEAGDDVAAHFGTPARFLKAGEAKALAEKISANPETGAMLAGALVAGAGERARALLAEFGGDAPMIAEAGAIIAFGGSGRAAEDVILGYGKGADGKQLKGLKADAARENVVETLGNALAFAGEDRMRIERAAAAIARRRIAQEGLDPASDDALEIHRRAIHEAAGATFDQGRQFGGFAEIDAPGLFTGSRRVLVDPQIAADRFEEIVDAIREDDLESLPVKPKPSLATFRASRRLSLSATIKAATPVAVSGGYAFALGDPGSEDAQFVEGEDGSIFVLDLVKWKTRLAARVPGAFR